jgi:tetratricopeptide (TPR) repeat protein
LEDVRFALDGGLSRPDIVEASTLLVAIFVGWASIGLEAEGFARTEAYLTQLPPTQPRLLAQLFASVSAFRINSAQYVLAFEAATHAIAHARESGNPRVLGRALLMRTRAAISLDRLDDAEIDLVEFEALPSMPAPLQLQRLASHASLTAARGDDETAARAYEDLRKQHRAAGDVPNETAAAINLAEIEHKRGRTDRAIATLTEYLASTRSGIDRNVFWMTIMNLAGYYLAVDDLPSALAAGREVIVSLTAADLDHPFAGAAIGHLGLATALRGDLSRAALLQGYANAALDRHGIVRGFTERTTHERLAALLRDGLSREELARLTTEGAALTPAVARALALEDL